MGVVTGLGGGLLAQQVGGVLPASDAVLDPQADLPVALGGVGRRHERVQPGQVPGQARRGGLAERAGLGRDQQFDRQAHRAGQDLDPERFEVLEVALAGDIVPGLVGGPVPDPDLLAQHGGAGGRARATVPAAEAGGLAGRVDADQGGAVLHPHPHLRPVDVVGEGIANQVVAVGRHVETDSLAAGRDGAALSLGDVGGGGRAGDGEVAAADRGVEALEPVAGAGEDVAADRRQDIAGGAGAGIVVEEPPPLGFIGVVGGAGVVIAEQQVAGDACAVPRQRALHRGGGRLARQGQLLPEGRRLVRRVRRAGRGRRRQW